MTTPQPGEPLPAYGHAPRHLDQPSPQPRGVARHLNAVARHPSPAHAAAHSPAQPPPSAVPVADRRTSAERFWYVIQNIAFGAGYFAKIPAKKAAIEVTGRGILTGFESFWYVLVCIAFGAMYFAKIPVKKALVEAMTPPVNPAAG